MRVVCLAVLFVLSSAAGALADKSSAAGALADKKTAVLVPPRVEAGISGGMGTRALEEMRRRLESSAEHFTVLSPGQAVALAEGDQAERHPKPKGEADADKCVSADCAVWFRRVANADLAVQLSIFNEVDERKRLRAGSVTLVLLEDVEARWSGSAPILGEDIEAAIERAFSQAQAKRSKGVGPWISVIGTPEGAEVLLDEQVIGKLPVEKTRIADSASLHVLKVRAQGYREYGRTLEMRGDISREEVVNVTLVKGSDPVAAQRSDKGWTHMDGRERPSRALRAADPALGAAFAAAGALHLVFGIYYQKDEDECAKRAGAACVEFYGDKRSVSKSAALIIAGAAGLAVGAVFLGARPVLRLSARASRDTAALSLEGRF